MSHQFKVFTHFFFSVLLCLAFEKTAVGEPQSETTDSLEAAGQNWSVSSTLGIAAGPLLGAVTGAGVRFPLSSSVTMGPEAFFARFNGASALGLLVGANYEFRIWGLQKHLFSVGGALGTGFCNRIPRVRASSILILSELSVMKPIDDFSLIRLQIRPGILDRNFLLLANLGVLFRFL